MKSPVGGYTLLEVMIFLAISSVIFATGVYSVKGQSAHTEFTTSANDVKSKMQQWFDQVVDGYSRNPSSSLPALSNFSCAYDAQGYPLLSAGATTSSRGANPLCVYLGKAIHLSFDAANPESNTQISAYTVLSRRTYTPSGSAEPVLVDNLVSAKPTIAIYPAGSIDLSEYYNIPNGTYIRSVKIGGTPPCNNNCSVLAGVYTSLSNASSQSGVASLTAVQYPFTDGNAAPGDNSVKDCVKMIAAGSCSPSPFASNVNPFPLRSWQICLGSSRNNDRGLITVTSNAGVGVTIDLKTGVGNTLCS